MSYTPPAGDALIFDFSTVSGYTPPAGDALIFAFGDEFGSAPYARAKADSPLGAAMVVAAGAAIARASAATVLGSPTVVAIGPVVARSAAPAMFGGVAAKAAAQVIADARAGSPLGFAYGLANVATTARVVVQGPFRQASVRAAMGVRARSSAPSILQPQVTALVSHDFTVALGDVVGRYLLDLVTPGGMVRAPISSWQATLQTGAKCYVQAVIPASSPYSSAINSASEFVIYRAAVLPSGMQVEQELARSPVGSAQFDRGAMRETCTISGYASAFDEIASPSAEQQRTLTSVRTMSSGAGGVRARCAVDWLLRPGWVAVANGVPFTADYINYYAPTGGDSYMDVGERA